MCIVIPLFLAFGSYYLLLLSGWIHLYICTIKIWYKHILIDVILWFPLCIGSQKCEVLILCVTVAIIRFFLYFRVGSNGQKYVWEVFLDEIQVYIWNTRTGEPSEWLNWQNIAFCRLFQCTWQTPKIVEMVFISFSNYITTLSNSNSRVKSYTHAFFKQYCLTTKLQNCMQILKITELPHWEWYVPTFNDIQIGGLASIYYRCQIDGQDKN